ncbi:MAG: N-acetylglucosamine-6-phosphate deacetylase [Sphingobacteriales bacterium]|nr:N-acetylglucosamine-6-phosphate deacetylase [Sphingobacteriales bacterium]
MMTALTNATIYTGEEKLTDKVLLLKDGKINAIINPDNIPANAVIIDCEGQNLAAGLIDLQIYGAGGKLFGGVPTVDALEQMEISLLAEGCTGFMATVATNSNDVVEQAIESAKAYRKKAKGNFLGLHLEGPYLNAKRKGAHPEKYIKKATLSEIKSWVEQAEGEIKIITIAAELQNQEVIDYLNDQGIIISNGHSDATFEEASGFFNKGVHAATHLFNAMPQMHHRNPGLIPAIFEQKPFTSIVADGIHVSFPMVKLAKRELEEKLFLITDAVTETSEGTYPHVFTGDKYTMPDGTLSGSCLSMLKAVQNCVEQVGISLEEALRMASFYPAQLIKKDHLIGKIKAGYSANLILFNKDFNVLSVFLCGVLHKIA